MLRLTIGENVVRVGISPLKHGLSVDEEDCEGDGHEDEVTA